MRDMAAECSDRAVESVTELGMSVEPIMQCCLCKGLLRNPVQLICLHNCCQQCFIDAASTTSSGDVGCGVCSEFTSAGIELPNRFIDHEVRLHRALAGSKVCFICKEDRQIDQEAVEWCPACRHALCENCVPAHKRYNRSHGTLSLESLGDSAAVIQQSAVSFCSRHDKLLELVCFDCEKEICTSCWENCSESKHKVHSLSNPYFNNYVQCLMANMSYMEKELLRKVDVLGTPKSLLTDLKAARTAHLQKIEQRKQRILQSVDRVGKKISDAVGDIYDHLEKQATDAAVAADGLNCKLTDAQRYIKKLFESKSNCDIFTQKNVVRKRLEALANELDSLSDLLENTILSEPFFVSTQPDDLEVLIEQWIGTFQPSAFSFSEATANHRLPVTCRDVALTNDGHLLLAADWYGLIELCSETGHELSRWLHYDQVLGVASLDDERAAVSLSRSVLLLKRTGGGDCRAATKIDNTSWTEYHRFDMPDYVPGQLSAHGDILAVTDVADADRLILQLMCLRSLRPLTDWFNIWGGVDSVALTPRVVVIAAEFSGGLNAGWEGRSIPALEAYLVPTCKKLLWRQELNGNDGQRQAICADPSGGVVYAAMQSSDRSGGHVTAFSLVDGSVMRRVALSFETTAEQPLLLPERLSLRTLGAVAKERQGSRSSCCHSRVLQLVALCWDSATKMSKTVTVYRSKSTCDVLLQNFLCTEWQ